MMEGKKAHILMSGQGRDGFAIARMASFSRRILDGFS
jgi:hypothetical protein